MALARSQVQIDAPIEIVWELVADEAGLEAKTTATRLFDAFGGKRFYSRWLGESLDALQARACERAQSARSQDA